MATVGWTKRSSNAKHFRVSNSQRASDIIGMRQSRSVERQSRIPLRSSSSQSARECGIQKKNRSKSQTCEETPVNVGRITPSSIFNSKITPICSSSIRMKKMNFHKDTRNLHCKEFIKEATAVVQNFFQEKCPMFGDIRPMTIKMFIGMVNYLFQELEIVDKRQEPVQFEVSTYEKELPYWMKRLNYPGLITKAWLQTVNVPNNWHHVIGLLSWLVKLVEISLLFNFEEQLESMSDDINNSWAIYYFKQSLHAYRLFNEGKEEEFRNLCSEVVQKFYEINGVDENEIQKLKNEIQELEQQLADPNAQAEKDASDEAIQELKNLEAQHEKAVNDILAEENDIEVVKAKIIEKETNCLDLENQIQEAAKQLEDLENIVSKQPTSIAEITELMKKSEYLEKEIKYMEKECEDYAQLVSRYEFEAAAKKDKILQCKHAFNRNIIQLEQTIPELKEIRICEDIEDEKIISELEQIVESLRNLKNDYVKNCEMLEAQIKKEEENIESKCQALENLIETISKLEESNAMKKNKLAKLQEEFEEKEKLLKERAEKLDGTLKCLESKMKEVQKLRENHQKLELRNSELSDLLQKSEEETGEFWTKVVKNWELIPDKLESLLKLVKDQNIELKKGYSQLMTDLANDNTKI